MEELITRNSCRDILSQILLGKPCNYELLLSHSLNVNMDLIARKLCGKIVMNSMDLKAEFKKADRDNDGRLSYVEFVEFVEQYNLEISKADIYNLMQWILEDKV